MRKLVINLLLLFFMASATWAQKQVVFVVKDDASPLQGPQLFMVAKKQNDIFFSDKFTPKPGAIFIENGELDSLQYNPEDPFSYFIIPLSEGPVIIKTMVDVEENGRKATKEMVSSFQAILPPDIDIRLLKNHFAKNLTLHYGLFDRTTGKRLSKRYRVGRFYDVEIFNESGKLVDTAIMQSGTTISFAPFPEPTKARAGHTIKFTLSIRDSKTGVLFSLPEVVQVL